MSEAVERIDYRLIASLVEPNARVLDLGCGDGALLSLLKKEKGCRGTGIEINEQEIYQAMEHGVSVVHGDVDGSLEDYSDNRFDYVILNESLQEILYPERVIMESLRVGKKVIVGIPNFCHTSSRVQMFFFGKAPVTKWLPYQWYNTPNLRFLSIRDFYDFCEDRGIKIEKSRFIRMGKEIKFWPNLLAHTGIFVLSKS